MIDITQKYIQLRTAVASGLLACTPQILERIKSKTIPKGDLFETARVAAMFAAKNTDRTLPHCHPIPVEFLSVDFEILENGVKITVTGKTIARTGLEMETLNAVSAAALTMYDMLKPLVGSKTAAEDGRAEIKITDIQLEAKTGGKSSVRRQYPELSAAVVVVSDRVSEGSAKDSSGESLVELLTSYSVMAGIIAVVPDDPPAILGALQTALRNKIDLIIFTGGTGVGPRDVTVETVQPLLEKRLPGMEETMRAYGQNRNAKAMLSRSLAGTIAQALILALPGSKAGARESMNAVLPHLFHGIEILKGGKHS